MDLEFQWFLVVNSNHQGGEICLAGFINICPVVFRNGMYMVNLRYNGSPMYRPYRSGTRMEDAYVTKDSSGTRFVFSLIY